MSKIEWLQLQLSVTEMWFYTQYLSGKNMLPDSYDVTLSMLNMA